MLTLDRLHIVQGDFALKADLHIAKSRKIAIIGPSGGGKSTLLSAIAGFLQPAAGQIIAGGQDITDTPPGQRPISLLFQDHNLFPHLTAFQNIALGIRPNLKLTPDDRDAVTNALAQVGLQHHANDKPAKLSGGQQQRVALARVLLRDKPLLLLDEPFAALGPALKTEMLDLVDKIVRQTGATLLMVTHNPEDARRIADETILLVHGQAQAPVKTETLFANPPKDLAEYLG